ncbi:MAG: STAS domain-containing protein [Polyangia bacterium]
MRGSLSAKITAGLGGLLLVFSSLVAVVTFTQMRRAAIEEQQSLADVMNYAFEILMSQEAIPSLQRVVENDATNRGIHKIAVVDRSGVVRASSDRMEVGRRTESEALRSYLERAHWERETHVQGSWLIICQPLRGSSSLGGAFGDIGGAAEITLSLDIIEGDARTGAIRLLAITLGSLLVLSLVLWIFLRRLVTLPVQELAVAAKQFRDGNRKLRSRIRRKDEIGLLSTTFDDMADQVEALLSSLEAQVAARTAALEEQRRSLEQALEELKVNTAARLELADTVRELSTPVLKLYEHVLVLPLIGTINAERAKQIQSQLLLGIERHKAAEIILDITGVPFVDTSAADSLIRAARAASLLGAGVTIVGITASVAQSIVHLGIDLSSLVTQADLQSGLLYALRKRGFLVCRAPKASAPEPRERAPEP